MKASSINILQGVKFFFTHVKSKPEKIKDTNKVAVRFLQQDQKIPESKPVEAGELNIHEFQRKAHRGNLAAGPYCLFDPRLIR